MDLFRIAARNIMGKVLGISNLDEIQDEWTKENEPLGTHLGYPECCIYAFCSQPPELIEKIGTGNDGILRYEAGCIDGNFTGFIPCNEHAKQIKAGEITIGSLIQGRSEKIPFPEYANPHFPVKIVEF